MLYDGEDRMPRRTFLKRYNIDPRTEKRVRSQGRHPWPPWIILGGRVFYSKELTARFFEQQAGAASAEATETPSDDELAAAAAALGAGGAEPPDEPVTAGGDAP